MKKILIVDDDEDILQLLKAGLLFAGFAVKTSTTSGGGQAIFHAFIPNLMIIDVNLGEADGRELCRAIKSQSKYAHIPILLISANPENLKNWKKDGAFAAIEKPFGFHALMPLIHLALEV